MPAWRQLIQLILSLALLSAQQLCMKVAADDQPAAMKVAQPPQQASQPTGNQSSGNRHRKSDSRPMKINHHPGRPHHAQHHPTPHRFHVETAMRHLGLDAPVLYSKLLAAHPNPGDAMVVEIGSFDGEQCVEAAKLGFGRVICLEPSPQNYAKARAAVDAGRPYKGHVSVLQLAGSNETGMDVVFHQAGGQQDHAGPRIIGEGAQFNHTEELVTVKTQAVDDLLKDELKELWILKVDTQGFDGMVMKGAVQTLQAKRPINIIMEVLRNVLACGYKAYDLMFWSYLDRRPSDAEIFHRPTSVVQLCDWMENNPHYGVNPYGYWSDVWFTDAQRTFSLP